MHETDPFSYLFASNLRQARDASRAVAESVASINALVAQTREVIAQSHRVITQTDALLSRGRQTPELDGKRSALL